MKSPAAAPEFFKTVLQQVCHFKVDVIAGDADTAAYKYCKNQSAKTCTILQLLSCSERCSAKSIRDSHLKTGFTLIMLPRNVPPSSPQQLILIVPLWLFSHGESWLGPES